MKNSIFLFAFSILSCMMSCETSKSSADKNLKTEEINPPAESSSSSFVQPKDPLLGKWKLEYISPTSGRDINHYKIQKPYLNFVDNTKVAGNNGCNNIAGEYEFDDQKIQFKTDKFGSTRMFCENLDEKAFINALASVNRWAVMEDGIKLVLSADDVVMMSFTKVFEDNNPVR
jgi:heat shock protein HslJ